MRFADDDLETSKLNDVFYHQAGQVWAKKTHSERFQKTSGR